MKLKNFLRLTLSAALLLFTSSALLAQVATGAPPFASFSGGPDVTNLGNLNVQLAPSIYSKPGRQMPFNYALRFDNSVWFPSGGSWVPVASWGWHGPSDAFSGRVHVSPARFAVLILIPGSWFFT